MAKTNDTIDGLLAEFRGYSAGMPASYHVTMSWADFRRMLDRLEAAHRREADYAREAYESALKAEREALREQYEAGALVDGTRGDCAKLRKALEHIKDRLPHMLQYMRVHWEDASAGGYFDKLMLVIDAALADPPRNCDLPEVAKDPWRAWLDDKSNWNEFGSPKLEIHDWLLAPATEKEGGAK